MFKYLALVLLLFCTSLHALPHEEEMLPKGCKPLVIKQNVIKIPKDSIRLVMVHNLSKTDLWITNMNTNEANTKIQPHRWSAFVTKNEALDFSCIESYPGHEQQIPCDDVVGVCEWSLIEYPDKKHRPHWIAENMTLTALRAYIARLGFTVSSHAKTMLNSK